MNLKLFSLAELPEEVLHKIDAFILSEDTNGEFINTLQYLSYHGDRLQTDSVVVMDVDSGAIKGVMLASVDKEKNMIISHAGTTFAGPVIRNKEKYTAISKIIKLILEYYESSYKQIVLKITPQSYTRQVQDIIPYLLLQHGYSYGVSALANIINLNGITSEEDIFRLYTANRRNHVRKAIKKGAFIVTKGDKINFTIWDSMNQNLKNKYEAQTTHNFEEIKMLQQKMPDRITPYEVYTREGEYAAFALVYCFKNVMHTQYLDLNYKFSGEYPNLLLMHELIYKAVMEGYQAFSFGASTEAGGNYLNEGLYTYKNQFGGGSIILPVFCNRKIIQ